MHSFIGIGGLVASLALSGCGAEVIGGNTGGGSTTGSTTVTGTTTATTSTSSTSTSTTTTSTTTSTTTVCTAPCCLGASCNTVDKTCVALVDNSGDALPGLRFSELRLTAPSALSSGIVAGIVAGAVTQSDPGCNLSGSGTFSWLLQFDLANNTVKTGGALPVENPAAGYSFLNQAFNGLPIAPIVLGASVGADGSFSTQKGGDVNMPIFLDAAGTQAVVLPLKSLALSGALSASKNCIGRYNAEGLDINNACLPDDKNKTFVTGASLTGLITLEDADKVIVSSLQETLCVLLAGNMGVAGPNGYKVCTRDANNQIVFKGDACSSGNGCGDAVTLEGDFAASAVKIN